MLLIVAQVDNIQTNKLILQLVNFLSRNKKKILVFIKETCRAQKIKFAFNEFDTWA